jgi:DNA repair exonuclease SbcCD nuclease subunit
MSITFIHTADWQIGKPFAGIEDSDNRSRLGDYRIKAIDRIAQLCQEHQADFVVVAGDMWDSITPTKQLVSKTLKAIGEIPVPVYVIPGNHDHGAIGTVWHQAYFSDERTKLAPNLQVLMDFVPLELESAIILPCPLLRRHVNSDLTDWLRQGSDLYKKLTYKPRIVLAHGSVSDFGSSSFEDDEEVGYTSTNLLNLERLPAEELDYVALGDWHGTKQIDLKSWYSGTPEPDRFPKGGTHDQGNVLLVTAERETNPKVTPLRTGVVNWIKSDFHFTGEDAMASFEAFINELLGNRVGTDLLQLNLTGTLGLELFADLEKKLDTYSNRLLRLKLESQVQVNPQMDELESLLRGDRDPLIARVSSKLVSIIQQGGEQGEIAREALKQLYFTSKKIRQ